MFGKCPLGDMDGEVAIGRRLNLKDDLRKKLTSPMKSVVTLSLRILLKWESSASDSKKKTKSSTQRPTWMVCQGVEGGVL